MRLVEIKQAVGGTNKARYFTVELGGADIQPPNRELLDFARSSSTFGFLTKGTARAFTEQVRERYADALNG